VGTSGQASEIVALLVLFTVSQEALMNENETLRRPIDVLCVPADQRLVRCATASRRRPGP
jgi:hypothetical protein